MRFKIPIKPNKDNYNNTRIIKKFLWLPMQLENELRWMEYACIQQVVDYEINIHTRSEDKTRVYYWRNLRWMNH